MSLLVSKNININNSNEINSFTKNIDDNNNNNIKIKKNSWWKILNRKLKSHFHDNNNLERSTKTRKEEVDETNFIKLFDDNYYFYIDETNNGLKISLKQPHLITILDSNSNNSSSSSDKTLIKIYPLKHGHTTIGSSKLNDIVINANDIELKHCYIDYKNSKEIILHPIARLCSIDGVLIDTSYKLSLGNIICFGESNYFRFNNPFEQHEQEQQVEGEEKETTNMNEKEEELKTRTIIKKKSNLIKFDKSKNNDHYDDGDENIKLKVKKAHKVRFNLPNDSFNSDNGSEYEYINVNSSGSNLDSSFTSNYENNNEDEYYIETNLKLRSNSKNQNFLSKLYKFELLSLQQPKQQDTSGIDKKLEKIDLFKLNNEIKKMPIITSSVYSSNPRKPTRSKSIGCEEDLKKLIKNKKYYLKQIKQYINELRLKRTELNNSSNCVNELLKSPLFLHIHKNLIHFIDDDDDNEDHSILNQQQNEKTKQKQFNLMNLNHHDDSNGYDDGINEDDENYNDDSDDVKLVTKSVPNSPKLFLRSESNNSSNKNNNSNCISFVYDVNLYTEKNNLDLLLFDQEKQNLENKKQQQLQKEQQQQLQKDIDLENDELSNKAMNRVSAATLSTSSSRSSSLSSLHKFVNKQLEPLEISEDSSQHKQNKHMNRQHSDQTAAIASPVSSSVTSSSSSSVGLSNGALVNDSSSTSITPMPIDQLIINGSHNEVKTTNSTDSLKDVDTIDDNQLNDEDADADSVNSLSESQMYLKDNYEKAKKERQLEEEKAVQEKKRLQEILDICMEFQIKEQAKSGGQHQNGNKSMSPTSAEITPTKVNNRGEKRIFTNGTLSTIAQASSSSIIISTTTNSMSPKESIINNQHKSSPTQLITPTKLTPIKLLNNSDLLTTCLDSKQSSTSTTPKQQQQQSCVPALNSLINKLNGFHSHQQSVLNGSANLISSTSSSTGSPSTGSSSTSSSTSSFKLNNEIVVNQKSPHHHQQQQQQQQQNIFINSKDQLSPIYKMQNNIQEDLNKAKLFTLPSPILNNHQQLIIYLNKEKCNIIKNLNLIKQQIQDIEMRQKEAIRDLEMERALLDVEHNNELKKIQNDEFKLKNLQQEHQLRIEAFSKNSTKIRKEIELAKDTMKNVEYELGILEANIDHVNSSDRDQIEHLKKTKQQMLDEARHKHEDLEFQLMELEAKYESELEDIQNRLVYEQDNLLNVFKQRQINLKDFDHQQTQMLQQVKEETEYLENERQKLIEQFKKEKNQLQIIEKKLVKLEQQNLMPTLPVVQQQITPPSSGSSSGVQQHHEHHQQHNLKTVLNEMDDDDYDQVPSSDDLIDSNSDTNINLIINGHLNNLAMIQSVNFGNHSNGHSLNNNSNKNVSTTVKDLNQFNSNKILFKQDTDHHQQQQNNESIINKSTGSLNLNVSTALLNGNNIALDTSSNLSIISNNNQYVYKFAELEHKLAITRAENQVLLEEQLKIRERELQMLQEERRKREDLEKQLNNEITLRERIIEENIKLRDKKTTQARPLTRYLPIRDNNFDLKQHVENSGHLIDMKHTIINKNTCRGYLLKLGQRFKTWNKRWFVFDRSKRTLCYYLDKGENKLRGTVYFQSINEVYVDHMRTIKSPDQKSTFVVKTLDRNFILVAPSPEMMRIWVDVIFTGAEANKAYLDVY